MLISAVQHYTSGVRLLKAVCDIDSTPICRAHTESSRKGGRERFSFRSLHLSSTKSHSHSSRLSFSSKDCRGLEFATHGWLWSFVRVVGYESRLGNLVPHRCRKKTRSWPVSAKAVNSQNELQTAENLREQLEALQQEAEQVRGRANSARLRFMRLTHVVEQLRQRAAMDVRNGKEDSARSLLIEKQKVMKALEASRQRAELLEQLARKLNVVCSLSCRTTSLLCDTVCIRTVLVKCWAEEV